MRIKKFIKWLFTDDSSCSIRVLDWVTKEEADEIDSWDKIYALAWHRKNNANINLFLVRMAIVIPFSIILCIILYYFECFPHQ